MPTLLMALDGPLQSWGAQSRFVRRSTEKFPTKSGVVGLLASALGRGRDQNIDDLAALHFGTRTDQVGSVIRDFQTEIDWRTSKAKPLTERFYLQDFKFVAAFEGDSTFLQKLDAALCAPKYPLFLGRRSCPPARRVSLGIVPGDLESALGSAPWLAADWYRHKQPKTVRLSVTRDARASETPDSALRDKPLSFDQRNRLHSLRPLVHGWIEIANKDGREENASHDPFSLLGGE